MTGVQTCALPISSGATLTLTSALLPRWRDTAASGHADNDLSAVYLTT